MIPFALFSRSFHALFALFEGETDAFKPAQNPSKKKGKSTAPIPSTPSRRAARGVSSAPNTPNRARGDPRDVPCLGCVKSCLAGKGDGKCYDNASGKGARCFKCSSGHPCLELPKHVKKVAMMFMYSYQEDPHSSVSFPDLSFGFS